MSTIDLCRQYDSFIGQFGTYVCVGQCALYRAGLTTALITNLQLATRYPEISGIGTWKAYYYFDPFYNQYFETKPSPACPTILEPTQERAICETIILKEHFDEGVLIESIKDYLYYHESTERLYDVMRMFVPSLTRLVDYWLKEAEEGYGRMRKLFCDSIDNTSIL